MVFTIVTVSIAVILLAYGLFAAVAPMRARHAADVVIARLLKRSAGEDAPPDALSERIDLYRSNPKLYSQRYRSEIRSTRLGGISVVLASILIMLWYFGIVG